MWRITFSTKFTFKLCKVQGLFGNWCELTAPPSAAANFCSHGLMSAAVSPRRATFCLTGRDGTGRLDAARERLQTLVTLLQKVGSKVPTCAQVVQTSETLALVIIYVDYYSGVPEAELSSSGVAAISSQRCREISNRSQSGAT